MPEPRAAAAAPPRATSSSTGTSSAYAALILCRSERAACVGHTRARTPAGGRAGGGGNAWARPLSHLQLRVELRAAGPRCGLAVGRPTPRVNRGAARAGGRPQSADAATNTTTAGPATPAAHILAIHFRLEPDVIVDGSRVIGDMHIRKRHARNGSTRPRWRRTRSGAAMPWAAAADLPMGRQARVRPAHAQQCGKGRVGRRAALSARGQPLRTQPV